MYSINGVNYIENTNPNLIYTTIPNQMIYLNNINNPSLINNNSAGVIYNVNQPKILNNNYNLQNNSNFQLVNNNLINNNNINSYYNSINYPQNNQYLANDITITNNVNNTNNISSTNQINLNNANNISGTNQINLNNTNNISGINHINLNTNNISGTNHTNVNNTNNGSVANNINALVPYNNKQLKNKKSSIQSNDFWQKIDSRKLSHNQGLNNSPQNDLNNQNTNNNNSDPMNQVLDDFFGDFFNNETPNHQITTNHVQVNMRQPVPDMEPHVYFHSFFSPFGVNHGVFQQNYSSNFGAQIARLIELSQRGRRRNAHPPATVEALKKLKRFNLEERFCKKNNGKIEMPNCCVCQSEIQIGEQTVLLPCGHMYHWECCLHWLKTNNTCPICRFEIK